MPTFTTDHEHPIVVEKEKLGAKGFFYMLFGGIVAGCLSQITTAVIFAGIVVLSISAISSVTPSYGSEVVRSGGSNKVAIVEVKGEIVNDGGGLSGYANEGVISSQLKQVSEDTSVKAVVLDMDSPGGAVTPSYNIWRTVEQIDKNKPVVVYVDSLAASGGYYVASGARSIVANETAWTGSIGVILQYPVIKGLLDRYGIEFKTYKSAPHKDLGSPFRQPDADENEVLQGLVDDAYELFVDAVVGGRGLARAEVYKLADGRIFTSKQALEAKLVDRLGTIDDAIEETGESNPTVIRFKGPGLFSSTASSINQFFKNLFPGKARPSIQYVWDPAAV